MQQKKLADSKKTICRLDVGGFDLNYHYLHYGMQALVPDENTYTLRARYWFISVWSILINS